MQSYWITFEDGSQACCDGQSASDAARIAEGMTGKRVLRKEGHRDAKYYETEHLEIDILPYPATPRIWWFDHPLTGRIPSFCFRPEQCKGRTACPRQIACDD